MPCDALRGSSVAAQTNLFTMRTRKHSIVLIIVTFGGGELCKVFVFFKS